MDFKNWLEAIEDRPIFVFQKDGEIVVYIKGKRYRYHTDAVYHDRWKRMSHFSPWKVLNQIKDAGEQLEPLPTPLPKTPQKFLF
jgi:hypothetical protein